MCIRNKMSKIIDISILLILNEKTKRYQSSN